MSFKTGQSKEDCCGKKATAHFSILHSTKDAYLGKRKREDSRDRECVRQRQRLRDSLQETSPAAQNLEQGTNKGSPLCDEGKCHANTRLKAQPPYKDDSHNLHQSHLTLALTKLILFSNVFRNYHF